MKKIIFLFVFFFSFVSVFGQETKTIEIKKEIFIPKEMSGSEYESFVKKLVENPDTRLSKTISKDVPWSLYQKQFHVEGVFDTKTNQVFLLQEKYLRDIFLEGFFAVFGIIFLLSIFFFFAIKSYVIRYKVKTIKDVEGGRLFLFVAFGIFLFGMKIENLPILLLGILSIFSFVSGFLYGENKWIKREKESDSEAIATE